MLKFRQNVLPRVPFFKRKPEKPPESTEKSKATEEIAPQSEPENEFQIAIKEISEKIRGVVNGFVNEVDIQWKAKRFGEPHLTYFNDSSDNEFCLSFTYLLNEGPEFDPTNANKRIYKPTISIFLESIFGQRVFHISLDKLLNQGEVGATLFREDLVSLIAGETAECYLQGKLGGIDPEFETDYTYNG